MKTNKSLSEKVAEKLMYYVTKPTRRCVAKNGSCRYSGKTLGINTVGCMVGSFMPPALRRQIDKDDIEVRKSSSVDSLVNNNNYKLPEIIKNNSKLMGDLQGLHDENYHWNSNGLTEEGKNRLLKIINFHNLDTEPFAAILNTVNSELTQAED